MPCLALMLSAPRQFHDGKFRGGLASLELLQLDAKFREEGFPASCTVSACPTCAMEDAAVGSRARKEAAAVATALQMGLKEQVAEAAASARLLCVQSNAPRFTDRESSGDDASGSGDG